jgi:hypothetical protein
MRGSDSGLPPLLRVGHSSGGIGQRNPSRRWRCRSPRLAGLIGWHCSPPLQWMEAYYFLVAAKLLGLLSPHQLEERLHSGPCSMCFGGDGGRLASRKEGAFTTQEIGQQ